MNRFASRLSTILLCLAALATTDAVSGHVQRSSCEPAADLDVSAVVVARTDLGSRERVQIDLKVQSWTVPSDTVRIRSVRDGGAFEIPERAVSLPDKGPRKVRYTLDLDKGVEHHLEFEVRSVVDPLRVSSASLRINLDPRLEPETTGGVIQYRAQMQGR